MKVADINVSSIEVVEADAQILEELTETERSEMVSPEEPIIRT